MALGNQILRGFTLLAVQDLSLLVSRLRASCEVVGLLEEKVRCSVLREHGGQFGAASDTLVLDFLKG